MTSSSFQAAIEQSIQKELIRVGLVTRRVRSAAAAIMVSSDDEDDDVPLLPLRPDQILPPQLGNADLDSFVRVPPSHQRVNIRMGGTDAIGKKLLLQ